MDPFKASLVALLGRELPEDSNGNITGLSLAEFEKVKEHMDDSLAVILAMSAERTARYARIARAHNEPILALFWARQSKDASEHARAARALETSEKGPITVSPKGWEWV